MSGSFRENLFQFWLLIPGFVCFTDFDFFPVFYIIFVTLDSFLSQLVIRILLLLPLWQKYDRFFVLQVCHLRQTFKPTAESCIFVHIILQETEECKM